MKILQQLYFCRKNGKEEWVITKNTDKETKTEKKAFPIYNQRLAGFLMMSGYRLMGLEKNTRIKGKNVFYFMDTEKIHQSIKAYFGQTK